MHEAIRVGDEGLVSSLLEQGASVNGRDEAYDTPLHTAAEKGSVGITLLLLREGAYIDAEGSMGQPPLHRAAHKRHGDVVQVLVEAGASTTETDSSNKTPLTRALDSKLEVAYRMVCCMDLDAVDILGTPLHSARGKIEVDMLVKYRSSEQRWLHPSQHALY